MEITNKVKIYNYNGVKNANLFLNWLSRKEGILNDKKDIPEHDCHLSEEDGCDCQKLYD